ncbi:hypothetical protein H2202_003364 [Exophiala xenobiotica]|nr:hypothetical protein H2202_003364 [Exophiala xenobiotica]KAK5243164.1 hypothetical protein LTS06_011012 [Exophiala xenobiotica]
MAYHQIPLSATLLVRRAPPTRPSGREPLYLFADSTTPAEQRHQESDSATEQYIIGIQERYDSLIVMSNVKKSFGGLIGHHHILSLLVSHEKKSKDVIVNLRIGDKERQQYLSTMIYTLHSTTLN